MYWFALTLFIINLRKISWDVAPCVNVLSRKANRSGVEYAYACVNNERNPSLCFTPYAIAVAMFYYIRTDQLYTWVQEVI